MNNVNESYSPLNNYKYVEKPRFISALDVLSTPLRRAFGGRAVNLIEQTSQKQLSTAGRVAAVFFPILFLPVAIISSAALLIKLAITPMKWEEKKVKAAVDGLLQLNQRVQALAKEGNLEILVQELAQKPQSIRNPQVYQAVKDLVRQKLVANLSWESLTPLLKRLNKNDRFELVSFAVEQRFSREAGEKSISMNADQIIEFAEEVFKGYKGDQITCYKRIMRNALNVVQGEDYLHSLLKIDLIDGLINKISSMRKLAAHGALQFAQAELKEQRLRFRQFPIENAMLHFYTLMNDKERLQKIHRVIESIRNLNLGKPELEIRIQKLVALCTTPDLWKAHQAELDDLMRDIQRLGKYAGVDEDFMPLVLNLHQITRDGVARLWMSNEAEEIQNQLKGLLAQTMEQLNLILQYFEDAKPKPNAEMGDRDEAFLQVHLKEAYFTVHQKLGDLFLHESTNVLTTWFEEKNKK